MKKILLLSVAFIFAFNVVCFAAVGGAKPSTSSSTSKSTTSQTTPSNSYKPSAPANSYNDKAPTAASPAQQATTGGFMRKAALLGGGMLLGGMLSGLLGFGANGMFATLFGMLFNVILFVGIFKLGYYLWKCFKNKREKRDS